MSKINVIARTKGGDEVKLLPLPPGVFAEIKKVGRGMTPKFYNEEDPYQVCPRIAGWEIKVMVG